MDAYLAIVSLRVVHEYSDRPISDESLLRILEAGRSTGSSQNRQPWKFYVLRDPDQRSELAETVYAPENIRGCQAVIGVSTTGKGNFDVGRVAQNMMLAAWNEGIGSCPNGANDIDAAKAKLTVTGEENLGAILSFGYPLRPWTPRADDVQGILRRVNRKQLDEIVVWTDTGGGSA